MTLLHDAGTFLEFLLIKVNVIMVISPTCARAAAPAWVRVGATNGMLRSHSLYGHIEPQGKLVSLLLLSPPSEYRFLASLFKTQPAYLRSRHITRVYFNIGEVRVLSFFPPRLFMMN